VAQYVNSRRGPSAPAKLTRSTRSGITVSIEGLFCFQKPSPKRARDKPIHAFLLDLCLGDKIRHSFFELIRHKQWLCPCPRGSCPLRLPSSAKWSSSRLFRDRGSTRFTCFL
jgi:hypothetical protein